MCVCVCVWVYGQQVTYTHALAQDDAFWVTLKYEKVKENEIPVPKGTMK